MKSLTYAKKEDIDINEKILRGLAIWPERSKSSTPKMETAVKLKKNISKVLDLSYQADTRPLESNDLLSPDKQSLFKQLKFIEQDNKRIQRELLFCKEDNQRLNKENQDLKYQHNSSLITIQRLMTEIEKYNRSKNLLNTKRPSLPSDGNN